MSSEAPTNVAVVARLRPLDPQDGDAPCLSVDAGGGGGGGGGAGEGSFPTSLVYGGAAGGGGSTNSASTLTFRFDRVHGGLFGLRVFGFSADAAAAADDHPNANPRRSPAPRPPPPRAFTTRHPTGPESTQADIFEHCAPLIDGVLKGVNGTIMGE